MKFTVVRTELMASLSVQAVQVLSLVLRPCLKVGSTTQKPKVE